MTLEVGVNSYVDLNEATEYIENHYMSSDTARKAWDALSDDDKSVALIRSTQAINSLKYIGTKKDPVKQGSFQFPRINRVFSCGGVIDVLYVPQNKSSLIKSTDGFGPDGLREAKEATIENAMAYVLFGGAVQKNNINRAVGLKSRSSKSVSESYDRNNIGTKMAGLGIYTEYVNTILVDWLINSAFIF